MRRREYARGYNCHTHKLIRVVVVVIEYAYILIIVIIDYRKRIVRIYAVGVVCTVVENNRLGYGLGPYDKPDVYIVRTAARIVPFEVALVVKAYDYGIRPRVRQQRTYYKFIFFIAEIIRGSKRRSNLIRHPSRHKPRYGKRLLPYIRVILNGYCIIVVLAPKRRARSVVCRRVARSRHRRRRDGKLSHLNIVAFGRNIVGIVFRVPAFVCGVRKNQLEIVRTCHVRRFRAVIAHIRGQPKHSAVLLRGIETCQIRIFGLHKVLVVARNIDIEMPEIVNEARRIRIVFKLLIFIPDYFGYFKLYFCDFYAERIIVGIGGPHAVSPFTVV